MIKIDPEIFSHKQESGFYLFFKYFWSFLEPSTKLADNWHIKYLCDELQKVGARVIERQPFEYNLIINISPGETKTSIATIFFPVWLWINDASIRALTGSYSKDLALEPADKSRDLIKTEEFQSIFGDVFHLRKDLDAKSKYGTNKNGRRNAVSVGSTVTGKHAHVIIVDDPLSADQAKSDAIRETANNWMTKTLPTRKVDIDLVPTILIMQRLHEDDCTAKCAKIWKKNGKLKHIRLPADDRYEISPPELVENYTFDTDRKVMNPIRKPTRIINELENELTTTEAAGQLGQDPKPDQGNKLKKPWFKQRFTLDELPEDISWYSTTDGAYTKKTTNSATGVLVWTGYKGKLYLRAFRKFFLEFPELCEELPAFVKLNGVDQTGLNYVEPKAVGKSLVQTLRKAGGMNIVEDELPVGVTQQQGKEMRVDNITPFARSGNIFLLDGVDWSEFISELAVFPNGSHDDLVDVFVMACEKVAAPRRVALDKWLNWQNEGD